MNGGSRRGDGGEKLKRGGERRREREERKGGSKLMVGKREGKGNVLSRTVRRRHLAIMWINVRAPLPVGLTHTEAFYEWTEAIIEASD